MRLANHSTRGEVEISERRGGGSLQREPQSNKRLRAGMNLTKPNESQSDL